MTRTVNAQSINLGMGTVMTHRAFGKHAEESLRAVSYEAERLEEMLSCFIPGSEISRINRSAGVKSKRLSSETHEVLSRAIEFSRSCQGFFDVTVGPLVNLWNGGKDVSRSPGESSIKKILPLLEY